MVASVAALVGLTAVTLRPRVRGYGLHLAGQVAVHLVLPAVALLVAWSQRQAPLGRGLLWLLLEMLVLFGAFVAAWSAVWWRWMYEPYDPVLNVLFRHFLVLYAAGATMNVLWHVRHPRTVGPYCPACNYCLIGVVEQRCPECGRAFTFAELDLTPASLQPPLRDPNPEGTAPDLPRGNVRAE